MRNLRQGDTRRLGKKPWFLRISLLCVMAGVVVSGVLLLVWQPDRKPRPDIVIQASDIAVYRVAFSPCGRTLTTAGADGKIAYWNAKTGERSLEFRGHDDFIYCLAFSDKGKMLASGGKDKMVRLWNTQTGQLLKVLSHPETVTDLAFCGQDAIVASRTIDDAVTFWDVRTGSRVSGQQTGFCVDRLARDRRTGRMTLPYAKGARFAEGYEDGRIELRHSGTEEVLMRLKGHPQQVNCLAFSPDDKILASGGGLTIHPASVTGTKPDVRLWDVETGAMLARLAAHREPVSSVAFSPEGRWLAWADYAGVVCAWNLERFLGARRQGSNNQ